MITICGSRSRRRGTFGKVEVRALYLRNVLRLAGALTRYSLKVAPAVCPAADRGMLLGVIESDMLGIFSDLAIEARLDAEQAERVLLAVRLGVGLEAEADAAGRDVITLAEFGSAMAHTEIRLTDEYTAGVINFVKRAREGGMPRGVIQERYMDRVRDAGGPSEGGIGFETLAAQCAKFIDTILRLEFCTGSDEDGGGTAPGAEDA
jgi:hypothetical protein